MDLSAQHLDLEAMPKAELHVHLRGAMPVSFLRKQVRKYKPAEALESAPIGQWRWMKQHPAVERIVAADDPVQELDALYAKASLLEFLAAYLFTGYFVRTAQDLQGLVQTVREGLRDQNIVYAEVTVSVPEYLQQGIELRDLLAVLDEGSADQPRVRWIVDLVRSFGPEACEELVGRVVNERPPTVVGVTLGGAEAPAPPQLFERTYQIARDGGLRTTIHAGEGLGAESVRTAVEDLEVERIGHGVRAAEDEGVVKMLAERSIPLEVCPTSNVRTQVYASLEEHPVRALFEAGVPLSINTDDPTFFDVSLSEELAGLQRLGFSHEEILKLARNGFLHAFDPSAHELMAA